MNQLSYKKIIFVMLLCLFFSHSITFAQEISETEQPSANWMNEYVNYSEQYLYHRFDLYSLNDIKNFRSKFDSLKTLDSLNEWEGIYSRGDDSGVGFSQLRWKNGVGFLNFYIYTCHPELRYINYGKVVETPEYIEFIPEFAQDSPRKAKPQKYVKVKWGERSYLVAESSIPAFAEKAVGIYVNDEDSEEETHTWSDFWETGDFEKELVGLPVFPKSYQKFNRNPITAKITSVGKPQVKEEFESGTSYYTAPVSVYEIEVNVGKNHGVKKGFSLFTDNLEEVVITDVKSSSSIGVLVRHIDSEKNAESCVDSEYEDIVCPQIKKGQKLQTQIGNMFY